MRTLLAAAAVVLVPLSSGAGQAVWVVDRTPVLDVPGATGSTVNFGYAGGATRLSSGDLLVADRAENSVRVIDASGKLLRTFGRAGQGPGEFQSILWAGGCGPDSLLIWDLNRRQATLVGVNGIGRQFAIPATGDTAAPPFQFSCTRNRVMAYLSVPRPSRGATPSPNPNIRAVTSALYRINADGAVTQRLGDVHAGEAMAMVSPTGGRGSAPRPLGRAASVAVVGNAVVIGSADSAMVSVVEADGATRSIRIPVTLRAPTREEFDAAVQATASLVPAQIRQSAIEQLAAAPMPERLPPIFALFSDPDGLLWVQTSPPGARTIDFIVMQLDGRVSARVQVPRPMTIHEIGRDYILGSYMDASDEMHVAVLRLRRS